MYTYRLLRAEEYEAFKEGRNILAKCPGYDLSMTSHVGHTCKKTPWISTSRELYCLLDWLIHKSPEAAVIRIDLNKVDRYYDISTQKKCFEYGIKNRQPRNWAVGRREVLLKDFIPREACELVWKPYALTKVFSKKPADDWRDLYEQMIPVKLSKKQVVPMLIKKIQKHIRPLLSVYRTKRILELTLVLEGITANTGRPWFSTSWNQ